MIEELRFEMFAKRDLVIKTISLKTGLTLESCRYIVGHKNSENKDFVVTGENGWAESFWYSWSLEGGYLVLSVSVLRGSYGESI